jgi:type II secretory pathway pseudopilin PulG
VSLDSQRGTSLVEAVVAAAIAALAIGAALGAVAPALHGLAPDARDTALAQAAARELSAATDVAKYDGSTLRPIVIATTLPLSGATPFPTTLTLSVTPVGAGVTIEVTAATSDGAESRTAQATIAARAPEPGSSIAPRLLVPAPTGAP